MKLGTCIFNRNYYIINIQKCKYLSFYKYYENFDSEEYWLMLQFRNVRNTEINLINNFKLQCILNIIFTRNACIL
jgi:hypothetical protein